MKELSNWEKAFQVARSEAIRTGERKRVFGWELDGQWIYSVGKARRVKPVKPEFPALTLEEFIHLADSLPRCAQRANQRRGGDSKVAIPAEGLARRMAAVVKQRAYRCDLPAPAIGPHWHLSSGKKRRR